MDRLMAQSGPALSPQPDCGVVATEIYNRVKDSYWREIIALDWTAADGKKAKHIACVWIPMAGANVQMFDKKGGTIILPTKDRDKGAITVAFQKLFPKANITHLFFLDEK